MENKPKFNKELFATIALQQFLKNYRHSKQEVLKRLEELEKLKKESKDSAKVYDADQLKIKVDDAYQHLLKSSKNPEKKQILENCKNLFESDSTQKDVDIEIETIRTDINATKGRNPTDSEIAKWLINCFSEEIFAVNKRTYDMSHLSAKGFLVPIKTSQGKTSKLVSYVSFEKIQQEKQKKDGNTIARPVRLFKDKQGNTILIEFMGYLVYGTPNYNDSIGKYLITKNVNGVEQKLEVFTSLNMHALGSDEAYRKVVIQELLSTKNIERSNSDNYIGEILTESILKPREEKLGDSIYTYQITSEHALVFDGEKLEAVRAYKQQEAIKKASEQAISDNQNKSDAEPEI